MILITILPLRPSCQRERIFPMAAKHLFIKSSLTQLFSKKIVQNGLSVKNVYLFHFGQKMDVCFVLFCCFSGHPALLETGRELATLKNTFKRG